MDTLVALGTISAFAYSAYVTISASGATYFDSAAMITTFVMVGRYLESLGGSRARTDLNALLDLQPSQAWTRSEDSWVQVDAAALPAEAEILIKAGERIPADCTVTEGAGAVDESLLTGESFPVDKEAGDKAMAGTLLLDGSLVARTTGPVTGSRLAQISRLIEETLATKPRSQRLADRAAAYFAVGIIVVAVVSFAVRLALGRPVPGSLIAAITVLVVACPCALGLATPLALTISLSVAARAGVLVRNPAALELAATVRRVVFDKTGTVTLGRLTVDRVTVLDPALLGSDSPGPSGGGAQRLLCLAAAVEQFSEHPLARAIVAACEGPLPSATGFEATRGRGAARSCPPWKESVYGWGHWPTSASTPAHSRVSLLRPLPGRARPRPRAPRPRAPRCGWPEATGCSAPHHAPRRAQPHGPRSVCRAGETERQDHHPLR